MPPRNSGDNYKSPLETIVPSATLSIKRFLTIQLNLDLLPRIVKSLGVGNGREDTSLMQKYEFFRFRLFVGS